MDRPLNVYTRRVQEVGYTTLSITLPKKWAKKMGVGKGSILYIFEAPDGSLILKTEGKMEPAPRMEGHIRLYSRNRGELERSIIALYEAGYDVIKITGKPSLIKHLRDTVAHIARRLIGTEVIEEASGLIILEVVLDPLSLDFQRVMDRMEVLVRASLDDLSEYSVEKDPESLKRIIGRDDEIDKFYFLMVRQASTCFKRPELTVRMGIEERRELLPMLYYAKTLERIGDTMAQLAMYLAEFKDPLPVRIVDILKKAFSDAVASFRMGEAAAMQRLTQLHYDYFRRDPREILSSTCLLYTSPSPRDLSTSRMPSSA
mgnify:CR=1 FL=1